MNAPFQSGSHVKRKPKFKVGQSVKRYGMTNYIFYIAEVRTVGPAGKPRYEYREIWTWWPEAELRKARKP